MSKIKRSLAILFIIGLVITGMPLNMASAAENSAVNGENTNITVVDDNQADSNTATDDEQDKTTTEEGTNTTDEGTNAADLQDDSADIQLNYIYVESPKVTTPGEQNIVVSWGDGTENISEMYLYYYGKNGTEYKLQAVKKIDNTFLFNKSFSKEEEGIYRISKLEYIENNALKTCSLANIDAEAYFGVNEQYDGNIKPDVLLEDGTVIENTTLEEVADSSDEVEGVAKIESIDSEKVVVDIRQEISKQAFSTKRVRTNGNVVVALDPGHGGEDSGANGNGLSEKNLNWKIANYCKEELEKYSGITVFITRSENECPSLSERAQRAVNNNADLLVSLHINSSGGTGVEIYVPNTTTGAAFIHQEGNAAAEKILDELLKLGLDDRGIKIRDWDDNGVIRDYYGIIRESKELGLPAIIVEHAFIDSSDANEFLNSDEKLKKLGVADAKGIVSYFEAAKWKGEWIIEGDNKYYEIDGERVRGWYEEAGNKYYFDPITGAMQTGWQTIEGKKYFFMPQGYVLTGWYSFGSRYYYSDENGVMQTGICNIDGKTYYLGDDGVRRTGWQTVDDKRYYFMPEGYAITGWYSFGSKYYYSDKDGVMQTGWKTIDGYRYYLGDDGVRRTGWQIIEGVRYYFDENGRLDKEYYQNGWYEENGLKYYYVNGVAQTGWQTIEGEKYFFMPEGYVLTGWYSFGSTYYYANKEGIVQTGWQTIEGEKYFFMPDGHVLTGWYSFGSTYYYGGEKGKVLTGLQKIDGKTYYFNEDGVRQNTCWQTVEGKKYYFMPDGHAITGWFSFGNTYYYGDSTGAILTGWQTMNGATYYFGDDGIRRTGIQEIDGEQYIFDSDGKLANYYKISGTTNYTASDFVKLFKSKNKNYPTVYASKGAATIEEFCQIYIEEAKAEGIRAEVAFCQAMLETGWLRFGGDVKAEQCNFAGIGATGGGNPGNSFVDVRTGIRAQIQHLKAYANKEELNQECVDPRFGYVQRGSAPYVEWLGIPDNPNGGGWAGTQGYGTSIINLIKEL